MKKSNDYISLVNKTERYGKSKSRIFWNYVNSNVLKIFLTVMKIARLKM